MQIEKVVKSTDGMAVKFVQKTSCDSYIETTYVDYYNKHIICFASQIGCNYGCRFCANGLAHKFKANLSGEGIVAQCRKVMDAVGIKNINDQKKPVLFSAMGCGDPLANPDGIIDAFTMLHALYPTAKFSMATTGVPLDNFPEMMRRVDLMRLDFKLMISLHSAVESIRQKLLPASGSLYDLMNALEKYQRYSMRHYVDYNVVLIDGVNDSRTDAREIYRLLGNRNLIGISTVKINKFNPVLGCDFVESTKKDEFVDELKVFGVAVETYDTNGSDIGAACGQLTAY